ncbi:hypothetical protein NPIL_351531 [Nephila pilipes]|uniref:Transposase n=1 Tax=Nephila pilipes TaxID=299642 RepID=A0A8X6UR71_NEPPI|nr:hypothetical protein NPIL_351531 [Nephila pilipes]
MLEKYIQGTSKAVYNIYTGDESWIYAYEPETKQQSTVWVFQDEAKPTKVVRGRSTSKQMIACFFGINGHVATVALEQRRTVNSEWYTTICLPEVIGEIRKKQKNRRIILHHDNASSHTSTQTKAFLTERKIELMGHPPGAEEEGTAWDLELYDRLEYLFSADDSLTCWSLSDALGKALSIDVPFEWLRMCCGDKYCYGSKYKTVL